MNESIAIAFADTKAEKGEGGRDAANHSGRGKSIIAVIVSEQLATVAVEGLFKL